jgi:protein-L-isoaspartate O-methyltransferase
MGDNQIFLKLFNLLRKTFFEKISPKFRPGTLKTIWDLIFVIFEKTAYHFKDISSIYIDIYEEMVDNEINIAGISKKDNVLVIGCGSIPATSILLFKKTSANIVSIDRDTNAVKKAEDLLKKEKLENDIKIMNVDGIKYPIKNFSVIFLLFGVKKPEEIFKRIVENAATDTKIIFRTTPDKNGNIDNKKMSLLKYFQIKDSVLSKSWGPVYSLLLFKR